MSTEFKLKGAVYRIQLSFLNLLIETDTVESLNKSVFLKKNVLQGCKLLFCSASKVSIRKKVLTTMLDHELKRETTSAQMITQT